MQVKARYRCDLNGAQASLPASLTQKANCCGVARWPTKAGREACAPGQADFTEFRISSVPDWLLKLIEVTLVRFEL